MAKLKDSSRDKLKTVSVATLTTALFKRGLRNQFIQDVHPLNPLGGNMVGEAYTLRYIPAREDLNPINVFKDREHPQRKAVEEKNRVAKADNCVRAKQAKASYESGLRIRRVNAKGEVEVLDDAARAVEVKRIQAIIESDCV